MKRAKRHSSRKSHSQSQQYPVARKSEPEKELPIGVILEMELSTEIFVGKEYQVDLNRIKKRQISSLLRNVDKFSIWSPLRGRDRIFNLVSFEKVYQQMNH